MAKILLFHCQLRRKHISSLSKVCRVTNVRLPGDQVKSMTQSSHELAELTWKNLNLPNGNVCFLKESDLKLSFSYFLFSHDKLYPRLVGFHTK